MIARPDPTCTTAVIREPKRFRIGKRLDGDSIREMIEEGCG
ncbi:MAG: hypothetical protein Q9M24_02840 [Mariprofundaceae bacterium]|nr:hypothetical protein [Mariprofundaceae bacterium]